MSVLPQNYYELSRDLSQSLIHTCPWWSRIRVLTDTIPELNAINCQTHRDLIIAFDILPHIYEYELSVVFLLDFYGSRYEMHFFHKGSHVENFDQICEDWKNTALRDFKEKVLPGFGWSIA